METKPSELGEMEDESLVAQVPCEPGVVTTAIPREVPGGAGALWTWVSDYSCTQRGDIYVWRWRILLDKVLTWCFRYLVRPVAMTKAIRWEVTWTIFMVYEVIEFFLDIGPPNVWAGMILGDIVAMKTRLLIPEQLVCGKWRLFRHWDWPPAWKFVWQRFLTD